MEGEPPKKDIKGIDGRCSKKAGATRDGWLDDDRMGNVPAGNAADGREFHGPEWNESIAS